jgi:hypothetical protein
MLQNANWQFFLYCLFVTTGNFLQYFRKSGQLGGNAVKQASTQKPETEGFGHPP